MPWCAARSHGLSILHWWHLTPVLQDAARLRWLLLKSVGAFGSGLAWGLAGWGHGFGRGFAHG